MGVSTILLCYAALSTFVFVGGQETQPENPLTAGGGQQCLAANEPCESHHQCCEHRCTDDKCFACLEVNAFCRKSFDCCSKRCELGKCLACKPKGSKCYMDGDCCEHNCVNGGCGGIIIPTVAPPPAPPVQSSGGHEGHEGHEGQGHGQGKATGSKIHGGVGIIILTTVFAFTLRKLM